MLYSSHGSTLDAARVLTIPLSFNTGEEVHTTEAQGMGRNQGYVHLQKEEKKKGERDNKEQFAVLVITSLS